MAAVIVLMAVASCGRVPPVGGPATSPRVSDAASPTPTQSSTPTTTPSSFPEPTPTGSALLSPTPTAAVGAPVDARTGLALDAPFMVKGLPLINLNHRVTAAYAPLPAGTPETALAQPAADAYARMNTAAKAAGITLVIRSAYRTFAVQADQYAHLSHDTTAPPGASEHQTGLAADITDGVSLGAANVSASKTGRWLLANAYRYGFIVRYPEGKQAITGWPWEPWHFRYVGTDVAAALGPNNVLTLEEYLGVR